MAVIAYADTKVRAVGLSEYKRDMKSAEDTFGGFAKVVLGSAAAATLAVGKIGVGFEDSMAAVRGVMKPTADEFDALTAAARAMGSTTEKTASQSADALKYLGMAGMSAADSIKILPGMVDLSTAGAIDLAQAADIATDSLTAMGLGADQMTRFGDVMAATITNANTNVEMMGETFSKVAPVAAAYGVSLEELAVHTGLLANAGIKAELAGTSLKNAYINNAKAAKALGTEGQGLIKTLEAANKAQWDANEVTDYYGKIALPGVLNLMKSLTGSGPGSYSDMSKKVRDNKDALKTLAATMRDTLGGSIKTLMSTLEGLALDLFDVFGDDARRLVDGSVKALRKYKDEIILAVQALVPLVKMVGVGGLFLLGMKAAPPLIAATTFAFTAMRNAMFAIAAGNSIWTVLNTQLYGVSVSATVASGALGAVKVAAGLLFAAFAGWEIGGWLRKWGFIETVAINAISAITDVWTMLRYDIEVIWIAIKNSTITAVNGMRVGFVKFFDLLRAGFELIGRDKIAADLKAITDNIKSQSAAFEGQRGSIEAVNKKRMEALIINRQIIDGMRTDFELTGDVITKKGELGTTAAKEGLKIEAAQAKQLAALKAGHQQYLSNVTAAGKMTIANDMLNDSVANTGKVVAKTADQWKKHWDSQWQNIAKFVKLGEAVGPDSWVAFDKGKKEADARAMADLARAGEALGPDKWLSFDRDKSAVAERGKEAQEWAYAIRAADAQTAENAGMYAENAAYAFFDVFEDELGRVGQAIEKDFGQVFGNLVQGITLARSEGGEFQIGKFLSANRESLASMAYSVSKLFRDQDAVQTKTQMQLDKVAEFASQLGWVGSLVAAGWNMGRAGTEHSQGGVYVGGQFTDVGDVSTGHYAADPAVAWGGQQLMGEQWRSGGQMLSGAIESGNKQKMAQYAPKALGEWTDPGGALISGWMEEEGGAFAGFLGSLITGNVFQGLGSIASAIGGKDAMPEFNIGNLTKQFEGGGAYEGAVGSLFETETGLGAFDASTMQTHQKDWYNSIQGGLVEGFNSIREQFNNKAYMLVKDLPDDYAATLEQFFQSEDFGVESIMKNEYYGIDEAGERLRKTVAAYGGKLNRIMEAGTVQVVGDYIRNAEGLGDYFRPEAAEALAGKTFQEFDAQGKVTGEKSAFESVTEAYNIYQGLVQGFEDIKESLKFGEEAATEYSSTMDGLAIVHENQIKWLEQMGFSEKAFNETMADQAAMAEHVRQEFADARGDILTSLAIPEKLGITAQIVNDVSDNFKKAGEALRKLGATQQNLEQLEMLRLENIKWKIGEVADSILGKFTNVREMLAEKEFIAGGGTAAEFTMQQLQNQMAQNLQTFESLESASSLLTEWVREAEPEMDLGKLTNTFESLAGQIEQQTAYVAERETIGAAGLDWDAINQAWEGFFSQGMGFSTQNETGRYAVTGSGRGAYTSLSGQQYSFTQAEGAQGLAAKSQEYEDILRQYYSVPGYAGGGIHRPGDSTFGGPSGGEMVEVHGTERITPVGAGGMTEGERKMAMLLEQLVAVAESGQNISIQIEGSGGTYADNVRSGITDGRQYLLRDS